eukprot:2515099-Rhodomonas_salina.1
MPTSPTKSRILFSAGGSYTCLRTSYATSGTDIWALGFPGFAQYVQTLSGNSGVRPPSAYADATRCAVLMGS